MIAGSTSLEGGTSADDCFCKAGWTGSNSSSCVKCAQGTFKPNDGFADCISCPSNLDSPAGAVSKRECKRCKAEIDEQECKVLMQGGVYFYIQYSCLHDRTV